MVSALARLNLDPWREASELANLPRESAIYRLAALIATLPGNPTAHLDANKNSSRLISLLPEMKWPHVVSPQRYNTFKPGTYGVRPSYIMVGVLIVLIMTKYISL